MALAISGLTQGQFEQAVQLMRQVAVLLKAQATKNGLRLKDFKLELGIADDGRIMVADGLSPDELRMVNIEEKSLDKDIFRGWLKKVGFEKAVKEARKVGNLPPSYPDIPQHLSAEVSTGYEQAVTQFWR